MDKGGTNETPAGETGSEPAAAKTPDTLPPAARRARERAQGTSAPRAQSFTHPHTCASAQQDTIG